MAGAILFLACASAPVPAARAGSATLSWEAPTQRVDGSALPSSEITGWRISWGCATSGTYTESVTLSSAVRQTTVDGLPDVGSCYFVAQTLAADLESDYSNEATKTFPSPPQPPTVAVSTALVAYVALVSRDNVALLPVGTVPLGTECNTNVSVNGLYLVPRAEVAWAGTVRAEAVFAQCE